MLLKMGNRIVGSDIKPLVIPEIGISHEGSIEKARWMIQDAAGAGAEIVKFQCHIPEAEMNEEAESIIPINDTRSIYEIIEQCSFSESQERELKKLTESFGMIYLSTPFSREAVERLEGMGVSAYKIGSGECNNRPLVEYIASKKKPVIISTGMNDIQSVVASTGILARHKVSFAIMHCVSMYPTPYNKVGLGALKELRNYFPGVPIGLSDHSVGNYTCLGAVALGASLVEKHFTSNKLWGGPDIPLSIDPKELTELINGSAAIFEARGGSKSIQHGEQLTARFAYSSVVTTKELVPGDVLSRDNLWVKRPGTGDFSATQYFQLIGKKVVRRVSEDCFLSKGDIEGSIS